VTSGRTGRPVGRRWSSAVGVGLSAALVLGACGGGDAPGEATAEAAGALGDPVQGGEITVGLEAETIDWLPSAGAFTPSSYHVAYAIYDPLLARSEDASIRPYLAESVEPNDDLTAWTLTLRSGVTFHDGTPLDAEVLKQGFDEYLTAPGSSLAGALADVTELRVDDELTVTYRLREPDPSFPELLTEAAGMPFSVVAARAAGDDAGARPVGTGPFRFERWDRDDRLVVVRNEDYWREGLPHLDRITFRPIPGEEARVQSLLTGGIDAMQTLRGSAIKALQEGEGAGVTAHVSSSDDAGISIMNVLRPPFDDLRIRRAFAHTVDQGAVAEALGDDGLVPQATQFVGPESPWYSERVAAARATYDLTEAKRLVQSYVDDPERSDGRPVGTPPSITYGCIDDPSLTELSLLTEQRAEMAGFDVTLVNRDQATHVARTVGSADQDPPFAGDYDAHCYRIIPVGGVISTLASTFGRADAVASNLTNFSTPELQRLLEQLRSTASFDEQRRLVEEIGIIVNENAPLAYGTATPTALGVRDAVRNVTGRTLPDGSAGAGAHRGIAYWAEVWLAG
jgi:peptide/nickel transport system substrate-binding protein